jgi:RNA polymerase sigma factor (sigma-70 family)
MEKFSPNINGQPFTLRLAEKMAFISLHKFGRRKLKPCRDTIDYIMSSIVRGYTIFDPTRSSLKTYLINRARFAIKRLLTQKKRKKKMPKILSLDKNLVSDGNFTQHHLLGDKLTEPEDNLFSSQIFAYIKSSDYFNEREKRVIIGHFHENLSLEELGLELNVHRSYIYSLLESGVSKLRRKFNNDNE